MSEIDRGEVSFYLKGKSFIITPSLVLIENFENEFGSFYKIFNLFSEGHITVSEIRKIMFFLIKELDDKTLSQEDIDAEMLQNGASVFYEPLSLFLAVVIAGQKGMESVLKGLSLKETPILGETHPPQNTSTQ